MSNLVQRIIFGILGGALLIFLIVFSKWTFMVLILGLNLLALMELYSLFSVKKDASYILILLVSSLFIGVYFMSPENPQYYLMTLMLIYLLPIFKLFKKNKNVLKDWSILFLGLLYISLPLFLLSDLSMMSNAYDYKIVLSILFLIWANDTGAYFIGKFFGKHKLFERISPKKTWEGSVGGLLSAVGIALILYRYWGIFLPVEWVVIALIITIFGSFGDLVESMIKRNLEIKDSGKLIPGHGGVLDRFDALFIAVPFVYFFLMLIYL